MPATRGEGPTHCIDQSANEGPTQCIDQCANEGTTHCIDQSAGENFTTTGPPADQVSLWSVAFV